jgi:hypothetical protein
LFVRGILWFRAQSRPLIVKGSVATHACLSAVPVETNDLDANKHDRARQGRGEKFDVA